MTKNAKLLSGLILIMVPTIQYGGYFLLGVLSGKYAQTLPLTDFQKAMFRAGHAHAGVLILLSLIVQIAIDNAGLAPSVEWPLRFAFPVAALFISGGFFFSAMGNGLSAPNRWIVLIYIGAGILATALVTLGISLLRNL